ncbi:MAG: hypothetical protein Tsb0010_18300 [Parvularculaceae bacterium]
MPDERASPDAASQAPAIELDIEPDIELDARGYRCPTPVLRMESALRKAPPGAVLKIVADDPIAAIDIPHFVARAGHELLSQARSEQVCAFLIRKSDGKTAGAAPVES